MDIPIGMVSLFAQLVYWVLVCRRRSESVCSKKGKAVSTPMTFIKDLNFVFFVLTWLRHLLFHCVYHNMSLFQALNTQPQAGMRWPDFAAGREACLGRPNDYRADLWKCGFAVIKASTSNLAFPCRVSKLLMNRRIYRYLAWNKIKGVICCMEKRCRRLQAENHCTVWCLVWSTIVSSLFVAITLADTGINMQKTAPLKNISVCWKSVPLQGDSLGVPFTCR